MEILGSIGQLYMFVLLVLLFIGSGLALWSFVNFIMEKGTSKKGVGYPPQKDVKVKNNSNSEKVKGGFIMANNGWLKLAVFSFVGIIVSVAILGLVSAGGSQGANAHLQHQQQGYQPNYYNNMNMQGGMNVSMPTGNMQMQGGMGGSMMAPMNGGMMSNEMMMQQQMNQMQMQQMYQMQMQINRMQQQMNMMNGSMGNTGSMSGGSGGMGGMSGGGSGGMSGGGGGGMGMMGGMM